MANNNVFQQGSFMNGLDMLGQNLGLPITPRAPLYGGGAPGAGAMPGNPMLEGLLASVAAQNPEVVANAAAAAGIPPPTSIPGIVGAAGMGGGDLGALMDPMAAPTGQQTGPLVAAPQATPTATMDGWGATVTPDPANPAMAGNQNLWQGLAGFKAPEPVKPIMNAGVSGAQKAPEMNTTGALQANNALWAMLQQAMQQRAQGSNAVGTLGSLIGG